MEPKDVAGDRMGSELMVLFEPDAFPPSRDSEVSSVTLSNITWSQVSRYSIPISIFGRVLETRPGLTECYRGAFQAPISHSMSPLEVPSPYELH